MVYKESFRWENTKGGIFAFMWTEVWTGILFVTRCQKKVLVSKIPVLAWTGPRDERRRKERTDEPSQLPLRSEEHEPLGKPEILLAALRCRFS